MEKLEWNYSEITDEGIMIIGHSNLSDSKQNEMELNELRELSHSGLAGYLDGDRAYKIYDPEIEEKDKKLKFSTLVQGDDKMSDKNDDKYSELKEDFRDSERRISNDIKEREQRSERESVKRDERFEKSLEQFAEDSKEREERFIALTEDIKRENKEIKDDIKDEMELIREEMNITRQDISNLTKHNESLATTNKWSNVATIIGISAIVVSVIIALVVS